MLFRVIMLLGLAIILLATLTQFVTLPYPPKVQAATGADSVLKISGYDRDIIPAAERIEQYEHFLRGRRIALLVNHTATVGGAHLVDTLLARGHNIVKIFAPEHGFRGDADNGEKLKNSSDPRTRLPIISLYGDQRRPEAAHFADIDIVIFDVQDVGVRFYTYTTSMTYMMEACAEFDKIFLVLDRPNPNGHYVDGAVLDRKFSSFVGLHPVPIVHGLTVAEYARMINEEGWLKGGKKCQLHYVPCDGYSHDKFYELPTPPSPNLTSMRSIYLYPAICLFEGTTVSLGRGTDAPFERYGHPKYSHSKYSFTPQPRSGSKSPPHKGVPCFGFDLTHKSVDDLQKEAKLNLTYLIDFHTNFPKNETFFNGEGNARFFDKLAGTDKLRSQIEARKSAAEIRNSWQKELNEYLILRQKYLLYPDFAQKKPQ
jgi:uncharacterized protein YbbC (DUF1343 family)